MEIKAKREQKQRNSVLQEQSTREFLLRGKAPSSWHAEPKGPTSAKSKDGGAGSSLPIPVNFKVYVFKTEKKNPGILSPYKHHESKFYFSKDTKQHSGKEVKDKECKSTINP